LTSQKKKCSVYPSEIKREMIDDHDDWRKEEKEYATWEYIIKEALDEYELEEI